MGPKATVFYAELIKNKYSNILWLTFIAFSLAPLMGGIFMLIMRDPEAMAKAGGLSLKAQMMDVSANWDSYFGILTQAVGVGGVLVFGFVASWIFGREYSDSTAKDLLSLPTSRTKIINAKFYVYIIWCLSLTISNLFFGLIIGTIIGLPSMDWGTTSAHLFDYATTTLLTILLGTPIALFAIWGKGYLAPLGFVAMTLVFSQIIAATGYGNYFPWAVPALFSFTGGAYREQLNTLSYSILIFTSIAGYLGTVFYWKHSDQS